MVSEAVAAAGWAWSASVSEVASEAVEVASLFAEVASEAVEAASLFAEVASLFVKVASLFAKVASEPVKDSHSALSKRSSWR